MKRLLVAIVITGLATVTGCGGSSSSNGADTGVSTTADAGASGNCAASAITCGTQCCNSVNQYCNTVNNSCATCTCTSGQYCKGDGTCATCACASGQDCGYDQCYSACGSNGGGCPTGKTCGSDNKCS